MKGRQIAAGTLALALMLVLVAGLSVAQGPESEGAAAPQAAVGTAFTFQARLTDGDTPANGAYDLRFELYNAASDGTQIGSTLTKAAVTVTDGLFTVLLDFGSGAFAGQARYLEVAVRPGGSTGAYVVLSPRQPLAPTPYALYSLNAGLLDNLGAADFVKTSGGAVNGDLHVSGDVGIGTSTPQSNLDVVGGLRLSPHWSSSGVHSWEMGILSAGAKNWLYVKDADDTYEPYRLLIDQDSGDVGVGRRLGIGTEVPDRDVTILGSGTAYQNFKDGTHELLMGVDGNGGIVSVMTDHDLSFRAGGNSEKVRIKKDGNVGIGTTNPQQRLHVSGRARFDLGTGRVEVSTPGGWPGIIAYSKDVRRRDIVFRDEGIVLVTSSNDQPPSNQNGIIIRENGNVGIGVWSPATRLDVNGTSRTKVLQITGGSDLAEPFDVSGAVQPGMVVAIDPDHAGQLRLAEQAYDHMVAGCVSGANGINPGLVMQQEGTVADGAFPVALTGRVYCLADAAYGPIQPGDLLTTSDSPGHAMKVTDHAQGQGAILGKAMSSLDSGRGLVLVLVALQ